jgi:catechol 2,3-dioxygenase-like lactoylglutathione lyase family enzyme
MTTTQPDPTPTRPADVTAVRVDEITTLQVADVDRAEAFYERLGRRPDIDVEPTAGMRRVRFTPPGAQAPIELTRDAAAMEPGPPHGLFLVVDDIEAARDELIGRGIDVSEIWHIEPGEGRAAGLDPERRSFFSRASFADRDGNTWVLEEMTGRLPGRAEIRHSGALARLLFETARRHGEFGAAASPFDWWDWYAAYLGAREQGSIEEEAAAAAGRSMTAVKHVVLAAHHAAPGALAPGVAA